MADARPDPYVLQYQMTGRSKWLEAPAHLREQVLAQNPLYMTAFDILPMVTDEMDEDELARVKYRGDLYFDWDGEIEDVLQEVNQVLDTLRDDYLIDPACLDLALTGGRGVHLRIPRVCYDQGPEKEGVPFLPLIGKEFANALDTPSMDGRVYSMGRGRMWRTTNVQRENGNYKVPVTADEMRSMTVERYAELVKAPREIPPRSEATPSHRLSGLYVRAKQTISNGLKRAKGGRRTSQRDLELLKSLGGITGTVRDAFDGKNINQDKGLNQIAMQLALTAQAIGIESIDEFLNETKEFIEARASIPGTSHGTVAAVRQEMRRLFKYVYKHDCYQYSSAGLRSILVPDSSGYLDLDGVKHTATGDGETVEVDPKAYSEVMASLCGGLHQTPAAVMQRTKDGAVPLTNAVFNPQTYCTVLVDADTRETVTTKVGLTVDGEAKKPFTVDTHVFDGAKSLRNALNREDAVCPGINSDKDVQNVLAMLQLTLKAINKPKQLVKAIEGLYVCQPARIGYGEEKSAHKSLAWISPYGCLSSGEETYAFHSHQHANGVMHSNVLAAPELENTPHFKETVRSLLTFLHSDFAIGATLGWLVACILKPILFHTFPQFPLLSLVGEAGSGKTTTLVNLMKLFYYDTPVKIQSAGGPTPYAWEQMVAMSSSIPVIMDEYKPSTLGSKKMHMDSILHDVYTVGQEKQRGRGGGSLQLTSQRLVGSVCYIAETMHESTAVQERSIVVQFAKAIKDGKGPQYQMLMERGDAISALGLYLIKHLVYAPDGFEKATQMYKASRESCRSLLLDMGNDRVVENIAVVCTGLEFLKATLNCMFGSEFDNRLDILKESVMKPSNHANMSTLSEATKAMQRLAYLSRLPEGDSNKLTKGRDYKYAEGDLVVDIDVESCFYKLAAVSRSAGVGLIYNDVTPFRHALFTYAATVSTRPLTDLEGATVVRMDVAKLAKEGISLKK